MCYHADRFTSYVVIYLCFIQDCTDYLGNPGTARAIRAVAVPPCPAKNSNIYFHMDYRSNFYMVESTASNYIFKKKILNSLHYY